MGPKLGPQSPNSLRFEGCMSGARSDWALGGLPCSSAALVCRVVLPAPGRCQRHGGRMRPPPFQRRDERANVHEGNEHSPRVSTRQRQVQTPMSIATTRHSYTIPRASWWFLGASWGLLGGILEASWGLLGASLGHIGCLLGLPGRLLGPSWRRPIKDRGILN